MCTILISAEEMAASDMSLWFTGAEYITRCITECTHLNINSSNCWSRGKKLLQVCPANELWYKTSRSKEVPGENFPGQVHLLPGVCVTTGREMDPVHIFFNPPFVVQWKTILYFFFFFWVCSSRNKIIKTLCALLWVNGVTLIHRSVDDDHNFCFTSLDSMVLFKLFLEHHPICSYTYVLWDLKL